jgi:HD superfamily phosphodiesterase
MEDFIPLYVRAKNKQLGELQIMDHQTLKWIEKESLDRVKNLPIIPFKLEEEDFELIEKLIPQKEDLYSPEHYNSIHGLSHILRVMFLTLLVCKVIQEKNTLPYLISASIHDIRRMNDNQDAGHGARAREWFNLNQDRYCQFLSQMSHRDLEIIKETTTYHETDYNKIPEEVLKQYKAEIDLFKACDALDRFRQPKEKWWINPEYVELKSALSLIPLARKFTLESEKLILETNDIKKSVFETARKLFYGQI